MRGHHANSAMLQFSKIKLVVLALAVVDKSTNKRVAQSCSEDTQKIASSEMFENQIMEDCVMPDASGRISPEGSNLGKEMRALVAVLYTILLVKAPHSDLLEAHMSLQLTRIIPTVKPRSA